MQHTLVSLTSAVVLALTMVVAGPSAFANHISGASYSGSIAGGGTLSFHVSADGTLAQSIQAADVPGNGCTFTSATTSDLTITNHAFSRTTGNFRIDGSFPSAGSAAGTIRLIAPGACDSGTHDWSAARENHAPVLDPIGDRAVDEGQELTFTLSATDQDNDPLTYSASNLPQGATFDPTSRIFDWRPACTMAGNYPTVHFQAGDGLATDSEDITITVNDVNCPPVIDPIGNRSVAEGENLTFTVSANDPDGDTLTYSASNLPAGATFDPMSRVFNWTASFKQDGSYPGVHFEATDGSHTSFEDITITVSNVLQDVTMTLKIKLKPASIVASGTVKPLRGRVPITLALFDRKGGGFVKVDGAKPKLTVAGVYSATLDRPDGPMCKVTAKFPGDHDYKPKTVSKTFAC